MAETTPVPQEANQSTVTAPAASQTPTTQTDQYAWVTQTVMLAVASGVAYYLSYLYQSGYCSHFNIPADLISLDTTKLIVWAITVLSGLQFCGYFHAIYIKPIFSKGQRWWWRLIFIASAVYGVYDKNSKALDYVLYGMIAVILLLMYADITTMDGGEFFRKEGFYRIISEKLGVWSVRFLQYLLAMGCVSYLLGSIAASKTDTFLVPLDNPNQVVVKIYGGTFIALKADLQKKEVYPIIFLYSSTSDFVKGLELKKVGRMEVVGPK